MKKILVVIYLLAFSLTSKAQLAVDIIEKNKATFQQENIFIHFDKNNYYPGETIWLKSYLLADLVPSNKSTGIKYELINSKGQIIFSKIFAIDAGTSNGSLLLPNDLPIGNYLLRAYSKWMLQWDTKYFYQKNIVVGVPEKIVDDSKPIVKFYPEGGNFVNGILNMVGYTCTSALGNALASSCIIISSDGDTITNSSTTYNGFGKFGITPEEGVTYKSIFSINNTNVEVALPTATNKGIALQVASNSKGKSFAISTINEQPAFIIGHVDDNIIFKAALAPNKKAMLGIIPTNNMPSGVLNIAVFNTENKLLAQRQTFINNEDYTINANITVDTLNTNYRAKNVFSFNVLDSIEGSFSISITNADKEKMVDDNTIANELLVYNKLQNGYTKSNKLLQGNKNEVGDKTDLVLLTSTPKIYDWQKLLQQTTFIQPVEDNYILLEGIATTNGKKLIANAELSLIIQAKDSSINYLSATADKDGKFNVPGLIFEDSATIYYQGNSKKYKEKSIEIINQTISLSKQYQTTLDVSDWLAMQNKLPKTILPTAFDFGYDTTGITITGVTVNAKRKNPTVALDERYSRGVFSGVSRNVIDFVNNPPPYGSNVFQYLQGRYSYLTVSGSNPNYNVQYRGTRSLVGGPVYMSLFLDEFPADAMMIATIPIQNIAMIKVFTTGFVGASGIGGAMAFYTKKMEDGGTSSFSNLNNLKLEGYASTQTFIAPEYTTAKESYVKKDNRTTLYWNPEIIINDDTKKFPIRFYNTDNCKRFKVIIQGFSTNGKMLYVEKIIE